MGFITLQVYDAWLQISLLGFLKKAGIR